MTSSHLKQEQVYLLISTVYQIHLRQCAVFSTIFVRLVKRRRSGWKILSEWNWFRIVRAVSFVISGVENLRVLLPESVILKTCSGRGKRRDEEMEAAPEGMNADLLTNTIHSYTPRKKIIMCVV
jgi:hypothetical protein